MAKKTGNLYDKDGNWILEKSMIKGAMRRTFRLSPQMKEVLNEARVELPPKTLKDGSIGKKPQVRYKCAACGNLFPQKWVQVDHKDPVVPLHRKESDMTYDEIARGIFCNKNNLQVLCSTPLKFLPKGERSCHGWKTLEEDFIREKFSYANVSDDQAKFVMPGLKAAFKEHIEEKRRLAEEKEKRKQERMQKRAKMLQSVSK